MKFILPLFLFLSSIVSSADIIRPKTVPELAETSVRIVNLGMRSGGSGSILKSTDNKSYILTNKHVCRLIEQGGYVVRNNRRYSITHYKKYTDHDLCVVSVNANFNISLHVSDFRLKRSSRIMVSGHPNLLPHIASKGHTSSEMVITLIVGLKKCTESDYVERFKECVFLGGIPVYKDFDSVVVSNLVQPGSSGSAVFNGKGELVGVVFAGNAGDFSYGFIVPHRYIVYFLNSFNLFDWVKVGTPVDDKGYDRRFFNLDEKCDSSVIKKCSQIKYNLIKDIMWNIL